MTAGGSRGFDARVAHPARVYDYWLGGKDNFEADRIAGEAAIAAYPAIRASARANRAFLARSVRYLAAEAGIRQFLDIGTGLPTANNTHEVAQSVAPDSRIVYVDNDPLVLSHARALLSSSPEGVTAYLDADLRDTDRILELAAQTLDFTQPVAIMLLAILHYIPDLGEAQRIVARLVDGVPPGSYLVISHAASDISPQEMAEMIRRMNEHLAEGNHVGRTRDVVAQFFAGVDLVEPGVVKVTEWRPRSEMEAEGPTSLWGGVGRKPMSSPEPAEAMVARVRESLNQQGMMATLGVELIAIERGRVEMALRYDDRFTQQHGFLHAGAVASVLDSACGYAAFSVMPPDASVLTVTYTINLLAPAAGQRFTITGQVVRAGRTLVVCRGEAFADGAERPFAAMQATMTALYGRPGISG
jgi:uncharacterized protein (TIGR00369 family)